MGGPTNPTFCLFLKAQLSQALEELGSQKQRADMVSPGHALGSLCAEGGRAGCLGPAQGVPVPHDVSCRPVWALAATSLLVRNAAGAELARGLEAESWLPETD